MYYLFYNMVMRNASTLTVTHNINLNEKYLRLEWDKANIHKNVLVVQCIIPLQVDAPSRNLLFGLSGHNLCFHSDST